MSVPILLSGIRQAIRQKTIISLNQVQPIQHAQAADGQLAIKISVKNRFAEIFENYI